MNRMYRRALMTAVALAGFLVIAPLFSASAQNQNDRPDFARTDIWLQREDGSRQKIRAELARSPAEHQFGLMFREEMADDEGMLFIFHGSGLRIFWMRNTPLSLDLLFFSEKGQLVHIIESATPLSDRPLSSLMPVRYVLELKAGAARRFNLGVGSQLELRRSDWRRLD